MDFWDQEYLKKSGKGYEVGLKKGEEKKTVYLKKNKNGTAEIGDLKKGNPLYTTTKKEIFKHKDAEEKPFFRNGNAVLRVYVDNFNPKFKNRTIDLNMNNHITHERIQMYFTLNDNGTAELNIPLNNPQLIWGTYEQYYHKFYIEPGDTLLITLDRNEIIKNIWEPYKYSKENRQPSFMGSQADVNRDLHCMGDYKRHNPFSWFNDMESLSYEQFQERYIGYYNESIEYLNKSVNDKLISEKSKRIAKADVTGLIGYRIMDYIRNMKNNVAKAEDLKFLKNFDLNDIYLLTTEHFGSFVNRYEFIWDRDKALAKIINGKFMKDQISEHENKKKKYDLN